MKFFLHGILLLMMSAQLLTAQSSETAYSDRIVAVVNDRILLKSDIDRQVAETMREWEMQYNQAVPFTEQLWFSVLESAIDNYVLIEQAAIDSVVVTDDQVNRMMDQRINELIEMAGSETALEQALGQSIIELRSEFRETFRDEAIAQRMREIQHGRINITRPEVVAFFEQIPPDSLPEIPEQVALSQIVSVPPPLQQARTDVIDKLASIRDSIVVHGASFEEMARRYSTGPTAPNGGLIPLIPIEDLVPEYSAAAAALAPGEVSEIVETAFGFHLIRLNRRVGDQIETNNLLIAIDEAQLDEEWAIEHLSTIRDSILTHGSDFRTMARRHSDDEYTRTWGGRIIERQSERHLLPLNQLDASLYGIALLLDEEGDISEPRPFNLQGPTEQRAFRIVKLDRLVPEHILNLEQDYEQIRRSALNQKSDRIMRAWLSELRENIYVAYKIAVPEDLREPNQGINDIQTQPDIQNPDPLIDPR
ncbi:MAG: peptidylprolyl isomerase [Balneolaceae bacterium]